MRWVFLFLLAGCGAQTSPLMFGADRIEVTRDGRDYVVFQKDDRVEIVRRGYARRGEHQAIMATMVDILPEATGCMPVEGTFSGDSGLMRGTLRCP